MYLVPSYKPVLKRNNTERRLVPLWTEDSIECLRACYECTDWDLFIRACNDINELVATVSAYITFCEDSVIPKKSISIFPNNKPWVTISVKNIINQRNISFLKGDMTLYNDLQKQVRRELKLAKIKYKDKVEDLLSAGNARPAWNGVKSMLGMKSNKHHISLNGISGSDLANDLNIFYNRFNVHDFSQEQSMFSGVPPEPHLVHIDSDRVQRLFKSVKANKSPGPDGISGRLLKHCSVQLTDIFTLIFSLSRQLHIVPHLWKDSIIIPVPKSNPPKVLKDLRPVALTSLVMKCFEKLVKEEILSVVQPNLDPLQFAYRPGRGVDDATCTLMDFILLHLDDARAFVRLVFIDFSSAFNCIQPHILAGRLATHNIGSGLIAWIMDFLTHRSQRVRVNGTLSAPLISSTGSPQGCVLSPLLFVLYTNECRSHHQGRHIIKFADDSVIVSLLSNTDPDLGPIVSEFADWCKSSFLEINVSKTKEMTIDFRSLPSAISHVSIDNQVVENVTEYKYLGIVIDDKLSFQPQVNALCKKANQRLYFLRKLRSFDVGKSFMKTFYSCFIESVLSFACVSWFGSLNVQYRNKLQGVINVCSKVAATTFSSILSVYRVRSLKKARSIVADPSHPLFPQFRLLPSGRRFRARRWNYKRLNDSFVNVSLGLLNK